ncbi:hypothetical protein BBJ28_00011365 [Nothophytophthora sp. Chile5]|nr:hypothetical protein BBJ28_00011365 [Nothophytophthora sp. Chile5]
MLQSTTVVSSLQQSVLVVFSFPDNGVIIGREQTRFNRYTDTREGIWVRYTRKESTTATLPHDTAPDLGSGTGTACSLAHLLRTTHSTTSKTPDRDTALFQRFKAMLAEEEKDDGSAAAAGGSSMTPEVFHGRLGDRLLANGASHSVEHMDEVASAILDDERSGKATLSGTVVLLPDPRKQRSRLAVQLQAFKTAAAPASGKKRSPPSPAGGRPSKILLACSCLDLLQGYIADALHDDGYAVDSTEPFRSYEGADSDLSDFDDEDGLPTVLAAEDLALGSEEGDEDEEGDDDRGPGAIPRYLSVPESSDDNTENGPGKEKEETDGDGDDEGAVSPAAASKETPSKSLSVPTSSTPKKKSSPTTAPGKSTSPTPLKDAAKKSKNAPASK